MICQIYDPQEDYGEDIFDSRLIRIDAWTSHCYFWGCSETDPYKIEQVKPYLRPMSSMTANEEYEYHQIRKRNSDKSLTIMDCSDHLQQLLFPIIVGTESIDWLNAHHFDYRTIYDEDKKKYMSMIEKGLALEVPEGMYT